MQRIIAGGTGFIGQYIVRKWLAAGIDVTVIGRSRQKILATFADKVHALTWDEINSDFLTTLKSCELILNLTGAGIADGRWSQQRKQILLNSRVKPTAILADLCAQLGQAAPALFNASGVGIYGTQTPGAQNLPDPLIEDSPLNCEMPADFLVDLGCQWEQATATAEQRGVRVVKLRFGVVLGQQGGALSRMALPFHFFLGGPIGDGRQPLSWVSVVDLGAIIEYLLEHTDISGPVNVTAPGCVSQKQFAQALGKVLQRPSLLPTPGFMLSLVFGEMAETLLLKGQHAYPQKLLDHGYKFQYPDINAALAYCYSKNLSSKSG